MEQLFEFIGNHPLLTGGFGAVAVILVVTEIMRLTRDYKEVTSGQAIELINRRDAAVVDVSSGSDFGKGHISGAHHFTPSQIESGNKKLLKLRETPVVVVCKSGQVSPQMAGRLTKMGFTEVHVLKGGLAQWRADNQPVVKT